MFTRKIFLTTLTICLSHIGLYAQVGVGTTSLTIEVPATTATTTNIFDTSKVALANDLDIDGNLRVADIPSAAVLTKTLDDKGLETNTLSVNIKEYDKVLVSDKHGNINHINISDFYAFNLYFTRYITVSATLKPLNETIHEEVVEGSVLSVDWLDFGVQYIENTYLEVKFRPNLNNIDPVTSKQRPFAYTATVAHEFAAGYRTTEKTVSNPQVTVWEWPAGDTNSRFLFRMGVSQSKNSGRYSAKIAQMYFFNKDLEDSLMIDIYCSIASDFQTGERVVYVTYWISRPYLK